LAAGERIALFDERGQVIGSDERAQAYANGARVGLVFVWVLWQDKDDAGQMLLQTRSRPGDPYLGSLDAPAGGHIQQGEGPREAARREFAEEVGIQLEHEELVCLGRLSLDAQQGEVWRRAMQFFYLCTRPIALGEAVFNEEVQAFAQVTLADFSALVHGEKLQIRAQVRSALEPDRSVSHVITNAAFAAYSEPIMDAIRRSARALQVYWEAGVVDESVWHMG
jgi:8-oxo-dGTP pyrophosphatase MutT (NUDIX family)